MSEILVVDDERMIRTGIKAMLESEGFSVRTARNGEEALVRFREKRPDLVLLDVMMPKRNGFSICAEIRSIDPLTPVVFLTAKTGAAEQVRGFGLGADDYIVKSTNDAELVARVRRAVERAVAYKLSVNESRRMFLSDAVVDFDAQTVSCGDKVETLTPIESDILWLLSRERGRYVSHDEIVEVIRASGFSGDSGALYAHVSRLKRKLGKAGELLRSERGSGYALMN